MSFYYYLIPLDHLVDSLVVTRTRFKQNQQQQNIETEAQKHLELALKIVNIP